MTAESGFSSNFFGFLLLILFVLLKSAKPLMSMDFAKDRAVSTSFFKSSVLILIQFGDEYAIFISSISPDTLRSSACKIQHIILVFYINVFISIIETMKPISLILLQRPRVFA